MIATFIEHYWFAIIAIGALVTYMWRTARRLAIAVAFGARALAGPALVLGLIYLSVWAGSTRSLRAGTNDLALSGAPGSGPRRGAVPAPGAWEEE